MTTGSVATTLTKEFRGEARVKFATFVCIGDVTSGSIPNTAFNSVGELNGYYLYKVQAFPTSGGTAPLTGADVFILDENTMDLLGSIDGGTTAYNGLDLIHATIAKMNIPSYYDTRATSNVNYYPIITGELTLKVTGQTTASADYTIVCMFIR